MGHTPNQKPGSEGPDHQHHGKEKPPESGVEFYIEVDDKKLAFDHRLVTGSEILTAAHVKEIDAFDLWQKLMNGQRRLIGATDQVDLLEDGIEHFLTVPKKRTDGRSGSPPLAPLTQRDDDALDRAGYAWSAEPWQGNVLLKIENYPLPVGYTQSHTAVALVIPLTYPSAQLDMFYFFPALSRLDGKPIQALAHQDFNGTTWQRWSRHRTEDSKWRPGVDFVETHLCFMDACLRDELGR